MPRISNNSVALAGEFAVLSQLALLGFDANMTLGNTKSVDILVSDPRTDRMYKLEVKTNYQSRRSAGGNSRLFGRYVSAWPMNEKHENIILPDLFYCFVNINHQNNQFRYFIVPSRVVAGYVNDQHALWIRENERVKNLRMRFFRLGVKSEKYLVPTPYAEDYESNWNFSNQTWHEN